jgi:hypothetical protein
MRFYVVQRIEGRLSLGRLETLSDLYSLVPLGPQPNTHEVARAILRDLGAADTEATAQQLTLAFLSQAGSSSVFMSEAAVRSWLAAAREQASAPPRPAPDRPPF